MTQYLRLAGETAKAYEAFTVYRELETGKRSLEAVSKILHKSVTFLGRWSTKYDWVERAALYDDHLREQERLEYEKARKIAKRNRIMILGDLERIVVAAIKEMQAKEKKDYTAAELTQSIRLLLEQERIEFDDLPTQKNQNLNIDLSQLSVEQLERIANGDDIFSVIADTGASGT